MKSRWICVKSNCRTTTNNLKKQMKISFFWICRFHAIQQFESKQPVPKHLLEFQVLESIKGFHDIFHKLLKFCWYSTIISQDSYCAIQFLHIWIKNDVGLIIAHIARKLITFYLIYSGHCYITLWNIYAILTGYQDSRTIGRLLLLFIIVFNYSLTLLPVLWKCN